MTDRNKLSVAKSSFERASTKFEQGKAALFRADGSKKYAEPEHRERMAALLAELNEAAQYVKETTSAALAAAKAGKAAGHADPLSTLTTDELQRAFYLRPFVQDAVANMALPDLAQRLQAIVATGDKAMTAVYHQAAQQRADSFKPNATTPLGDRRVVPGLGDVTQLVGTLAGTLADPTTTVAAYKARVSAARRPGSP